MNSRTTLFLAILLAGLIAGYYALTRPTRLDVPDTSPNPVDSEIGTVRALFPEPLGTPKKIVVARGGEEWVFEKGVPESGGAAVWQIVQPTTGRAVGFELDRIGREASQIKYEIRYAPGSMDPKEAGLEPPFATITLTDESDRTAAIEIGKPVSDVDTYARIVDDDAIVVAKANLRKLLKSRLLEYRDLQLWNFVPEHATHIEVCETPSGQAPSCLQLVREGGQWRFDRPMKARATPKVDEMLRALARLRVAGWHDDDASKVRIYGLDPGALQINVTVEETVPVVEAERDAPEDGEEPAEPKTEKRTKVYRLQVADRGPIGDDAKVFVRAADESAVATLFKSAADKLKPVLSEWREMKIVPKGLTDIARIEMTVGDESAVLVRNESQWAFESDSSPADAHAVTELLSAIESLKAVTFVEGADADETLSFENPQADFGLTSLDSERSEQVTVGGFTDPVKKLLVFVKRGDTIAKVRASDLPTLIRSPGTLRDRTIFSFSASDVAGLEITRPNGFIPDLVQNFSLARDESGWVMRSPVEAPAHTENTNKLVESLSALKADAVADVAKPSSDPSLDALTSIINIQFKADPQSSAMPAAMSLMIRQEGDKVYASLPGRDVQYELNKAVLDQVLAEFRTLDDFEFNVTQVQRITLRTGEDSNSFVRRDGRWMFEPEPDLPVDTVKIDRILTELKAARPERYAAYAPNQLSSFDLDPAFQEITLDFSTPTPDGQTSRSLRISERSVSIAANPPTPPPAVEAQPAQEPTTAHFATWSGREGVFLLDADKVKSIFLSLSDLEKS